MPSNHNFDTVKILAGQTDAERVVDVSGYKLISITVGAGFDGTKIVPKGHALANQDPADCGALKSDGNAVEIGAASGETVNSDTYAAAIAGVNTLLLTSDAAQVADLELHISMYA